MDTAGLIGPLTHAFLKDLGRQIALVTSEEKSYSYLVQRVSVAIQRGNAASVVGAMGQLGSFDKFLE